MLRRCSHFVRSCDNPAPTTGAFQCSTQPLLECDHAFCVDGAGASRLALASAAAEPLKSRQNKQGVLPTEIRGIQSRYQANEIAPRWYSVPVDASSRMAKERPDLPRANWKEGPGREISVALSDACRCQFRFETRFGRRIGDR